MQATPQPEAVHTAEPLAGEGHTLPHFPQFSGSVASGTHVDPQAEYPVLQLTPQPVAPHAGPPLAGAGQATAQSRQFIGSMATFTQEPPQFLAPTGQLETHLLPEQPSPAAQAWPHEPQLAASLSVLTHNEPHLAKP